MTFSRTQTSDNIQRTTDKKIQGFEFWALCSEEEHGGNIYRAAKELGISESEIIDFSASINPLGVSERVKEAIKKDLDNLVNYPDSECRALRERIAEHHGIDPETIICGNGSTELIYLIPGALKPEKVLIPAPTFSEYERAVSRAQNTEPACRTGRHITQIKHLLLNKKDGFIINVVEFISAIEEMTKKTEDRRQNIERNNCNDSLCSGLRAPGSEKMAFLCNPNNPTGHLLTRPEVLEIAEAAKRRECLLLVDEAFIDFVPDESVIRDVQDNPYLIVLRSMTKFFALTGLRIGYGVFHKDLIGKIKEFKEPWTVNSLAQKAAITALDDSEYEKETFSMMEKEKEFIENGFLELGIEFFPSSVNYYILKTENAERIASDLWKTGVLVRACSNFRGLDSSCIRVAVKSRKDNEKLLKELSQLFSHQW